MTPAEENLKIWIEEVLAGVHPATRSQLEAAFLSGMYCIALDVETVSPRHSPANRLARQTAKFAKREILRNAEAAVKEMGNAPPEPPPPPSAN